MDEIIVSAVLSAKWSRIQEVAEELGVRLELESFGCEGGAAVLRLVDVETGISLDVMEDPDHDYYS